MRHYEIAKSNKRRLTREMRRTLESFLGEDDAKNYPLRSSLPRYERTLSLIYPILMTSESLRILDFGTGEGYMSLLIKIFFPQHHIVAGDVEITDSCRRRLTNVGVEVLPQSLKIGPDSEIPIKSQSFDVVCLFEVLEHIIADPRHVFSEINRILKVDGYLFLTTPNIAHLYNRVLLLLGKQPQFWLSGLRHEFEAPRGHFREWTAAELLHLLKDSFEVKKCIFLNSVGKKGLVKERKLLKVLYYPYKLLCFFRPSFRDTIEIICQKK